MEDRTERWNTRHAAAPAPTPADAHPLLALAVDGLTPGRALDLACGTGRHALALLEHGWDVVAVDASPVALLRLEAAARALGRARALEARRADLEAPDPPAWLAPGSHDLVLDFFFLHRPLFTAALLAVRPGGRFAAAIPVQVPSAPPRHAFHLAPGELLELAAPADWRVRHTREVDGVAELVVARPLTAAG